MLNKFNKFAVLIACLMFGLLGCEPANGPQKTLDEMAEALKKNDSAAFLAKIDMKSFAANHIKNMTENDEALSSLNALGNILGLGNLDDLIGSIMDMQSKLSQELDRGVSSGELVIECRRSERPDCPWVPASLREAAIVQLDENAAIARVTTPAQLTSWLALRKIDGQWKIVGQAVLENRAREYATQGAPAQGAPKTTAAPVNI